MRVPIGLAVSTGIVGASILAIMPPWNSGLIIGAVVIPGMGCGDSPPEKR